MKITKTKLSSPVDPVKVLQERNFKQENIDHVQQSLQNLKVVDCYSEFMSELIYDDILNKDVMVIIKDIVVEYDNGASITIRQDNVGKWCALKVPTEESYTFC